MAIIRWNNDVWSPTEEMERLQREINDLFSLPEYPSRRGIFDRSISPPMDLIETEDGFVVYCDLPGIDEKQVSVSVTPGVLTIKGERTAEPKGAKTKVYRSETWEGRFQRTLAIPSQVDTGAIDARLVNGLLRIQLPKREEHKPKQIELKVK